MQYGVDVGIRGNVFGYGWYKGVDIVVGDFVQRLFFEIGKQWFELLVGGLVVCQKLEFMVVVEVDQVFGGEIVFVFGQLVLVVVNEYLFDEIFMQVVVVQVVFFFYWYQWEMGYQCCCEQIVGVMVCYFIVFVVNVDVFYVVIG